MSFAGQELPFNTDQILSGLKDFQRASVDNAFDRLYVSGQADRFLIADEVGLGKTMIAKGITAKAVEHLWNGEEAEHRIDVVYICSNRAIAQQNIRKLDITGGDRAFSTRMTLIAKQIEGLRANKLNFVSFTPGTSFDLKSSMGLAQERVLIWNLLRRVVDHDLLDEPGVRHLFRGGVTSIDDFDRRLDSPDVPFRVDAQLAADFGKRVVHFGLHKELEVAAVAWADGQLLGEEGQPQRALVSTLRKILAEQCVAAIEPDLIILDEFQRFRSLLAGESKAGALANQLFEFEGAKTLLLSATPYKMFTNAAEGEDHHADFVQTVNFLTNKTSVDFEEALDTYRLCIANLEGTPIDDLIAARQSLETELRKVMSRTERLAASADRSGMLEEIHQPGAHLSAQDVRTYVALDKLGQHLKSSQMVDYWKSAPCFLNFTDGYKLDESIDRSLAEPGGRAETSELVEAVEGQVNWQAWRQYEEFDVSNVSFRNLVAETTGVGAWQMLWLAPSLPYYKLEGPWADPVLSKLTKRLIFSKWAATPKAIATLLSYDAERRILGPDGARASNNGPARKREGGRLTFDRGSGSADSMSVWSLLYPSWTLAEAGDPLAIARGFGGELSIGEVRAHVALKVEGLLEPFDAPQAGRIDQRWYWAAPLLLDAADKRSPWLSPKYTSAAGIENNFGTDEEDEQAEVEGETSAFHDHVQVAMDTYADGLDLGAMPGDLVEVLVETALSAPGNVALRALTRIAPTGSEAERKRVWSGACTIASGFRSLFNQPEATAVVRSQGSGDVYWRAVLEYGTAGGISSVVDEFVHVSKEWLGIVDVCQDDIAKIANSIAEALSLRAVGYDAKDHLEQSGADRQRLRSHFALRFGDEKAESDTTVVRSGHLRAAFNSPFWPFVLASTSVGQEGLDFHLYCHAITHWNLPHNPVDMEQREGRVHRFKGHAVRRNVAAAMQDVAWGSEGDPWAAMFDAASAGRKDGENDLVPYWIYPGPYKIERRAEALPMSRELRQLSRLKSAVARYRLVFGQPRQDDLLEYLAGIEDKSLLDELVIDLSPRW